MVRRAVFAAAAVALGCAPAANPSSPPGSSGAEETTPTPLADSGTPNAGGPAEGSGNEGPGEQSGDQGVTSRAPESSSETDKPLPKPLHADVEPGCGSELGVGSKVKGFKLPSADGEKSISPAGYRGRVMLLNFWGTWCKPCLKELPEFDRLYRRYRKHGMTLVAVATDESPGKVLEFAEERKLRAKMAIRGEAHAGSYGAKTFPFTFVVDHQGIIRAAYEGYEPRCLGKIEADLREQLERRAKHRKGAAGDAH